jgi:hypothetical protein
MVLPLSSLCRALAGMVACPHVPTIIARQGVFTRHVLASPAVESIGCGQADSRPIVRPIAQKMLKNSSSGLQLSVDNVAPNAKT